MSEADDATAPNATRVCLLVFVGTLALQAAWILTLAPFRGADEFDHAYRAASVAGGHWLPTGQVAVDGRGELVRVPSDIVRDAGPVCRDLSYVGVANCRPEKQFGDGTVTVASAAARYNPAFYWVMGTPASWFDGAQALYVMRIVGALLCSITLAIAAWTLTRWARTTWPVVSLAVIVTPVMAYSTAVAAPNGLEMTAAAGLALVILPLDRVGPRDQRVFLMLAIMFAVIVTTLRGLGPLWLLCIVLIAVAWHGPRTVGTLLRPYPRFTAVGVLVVGAATASAGWWTSYYGSMELEPVAAQGNAFLVTLQQVPLWFLQSIAAFPSRTEPAGLSVYAAGLLVLGGLLALGIRAAAVRERYTFLLAFALALLVPSAIQISVFDTASTIWQGRYGWPVSLTLIVLAGLSLDRRPPSRELGSAVLLGMALAWLWAHLWSVVPLIDRELVDSPLAGDPRWLQTSGWFVGLLVVLGNLAWWVAVSRWRRAGPEALQAPEPRGKQLVSP